MFKSYTRKSTAKIGAERAGKTEADLVQVDGKWGFYENDPVVVDEPVKNKMVDAILNGIVNNETIVKYDRRKTKRIFHRMLKRQHRLSREINQSGGEMTKSLINKLRSLGSYRKGNLKRIVAIDDLGNIRVLA